LSWGKKKDERGQKKNSNTRHPRLGFYGNNGRGGRETLRRFFGEAAVGSTLEHRLQLFSQNKEGGHGARGGGRIPPLWFGKSWIGGFELVVKKTPPDPHEGLTRGDEGKRVLWRTQTNTKQEKTRGGRDPSESLSLPTLAE